MKEIDTASNEIIRSISLAKDAQEPKAMGIAPDDNSFWLLSKKQVFKIDSSGGVLVQINLKDLDKGMEDAEFLLAEPYSATVWIGAKKSILHLDSRGILLSDTEIDHHSVKGMALTLDESVWVVTEKELIHIARDGSVILTQDLKDILHGPKHIAVDSLRSFIYLAGEDEVIQFDISSVRS